MKHSSEQQPKLIYQLQYCGLLAPGQTNCTLIMRRFDSLDHDFKAAARFLQHSYTFPSLISIAQRDHECQY